MKKILAIISCIMMNLFVSVQSEGAVTDSSYYGFTVKFDATLGRPPDVAYLCLVDDIGEWWNADHTFSGKSSNLTLDATFNGCFCEKLENGGFVRHMSVVFAEPGKVLRMQGGLGPLQSMAVTGTMTFLFAVEGVGTRLTVTYSVGGYTPGGLAKMAGIVDTVLGEQIGRYTKYCGK